MDCSLKGTWEKRRYWHFAAVCQGCCSILFSCRDSERTAFRHCKDIVNKTKTLEPRANQHLLHLYMASQSCSCNTRNRIHTVEFCGLAHPQNIWMKKKGMLRFVFKRTALARSFCSGVEYTTDFQWQRNTMASGKVGHYCIPTNFQTSHQ